MELVSVSYPLKNGQIVSFESGSSRSAFPTYVTVTDGDKSYQFGHYALRLNHERGKPIVEEHKQIALQIENLPQVSLGALTKVFGERNLGFASYCMKDTMEATVWFNKGKVTKYEIIEGATKTEGSLKGQPKRKFTQEAVTNDLELMKFEVKQLLKK